MNCPRHRAKCWTVRTWELRCLGADPHSDLGLAVWPRPHWPLCALVFSLLNVGGSSCFLHVLWMVAVMTFYPFHFPFSHFQTFLVGYDVQAPFQPSRSCLDVNLSTKTPVKLTVSMHLCKMSYILPDLHDNESSFFHCMREETGPPGGRRGCGSWGQAGLYPRSPTCVGRAGYKLPIPHPGS